MLVSYRSQEGRSLGSGQEPSAVIAVASWLPALRGVTPHGFRHGLQTWMDEDGIPWYSCTPYMVTSATPYARNYKTLSNGAERIRYVNALLSVHTPSCRYWIVF
jgi:hypothetical protein